MTYTEISSDIPLLGALQLLPFLTGLLLIHIRGVHAVIIASTIAIAQVVLSLYLYTQFDANQPAGVMQFAEVFQILGAFHYHAAVDGMGVMFVMLTSIIGLLCVVFIVFRRLHDTPILSFMMGIQATITSQFVTVDLLWFVIMSLVEAVFITNLTKRWPTFHDIQPTLSRYLHFMVVGFLLMLFGTLLLGWTYAEAHNGEWSFSLYELAELNLEQGDKVGTLVFFALFYALAIRIPLFPFHGWLPGFMLHGNVAIAPIYLLGLKVGVYGLIRFVFPIVPGAVWDWHVIAVIFAATGVFYAAFLAMRQKTLRELLAFAVISHTGILTIGLFSLHKMALEGSVLLSLNFGLSITGLLLMTGMVWQRTKTTKMSRLGGLFDYIPMVGIGFLVAGFAIVGMPGTPGFDAVHFVLEGSIKRFGAVVTIAAAVGNLIAAGFLLRAFQLSFLSTPHSPVKRWDTHPTYLTEKIISGIVIVIIVGVGFFSAPWIKLIEQPVAGIDAIFSEYRPANEESNKGGNH